MARSPVAPKMTSVVGWTGSRSSPSISGFSCSSAVAIAYSAVGLAWVEDFTAWPPNWLRSAGVHLGRERVLPREEKRANSDVVMHGRGDPLVDRVEHRPAPLAGVLHVAAEAARGRCPPARTRARPARTATSGRPSPASTGGRSSRCRGRTRTRRTARSPRRTPASSRTRRRCGPSSRSGPRRAGRCAPSRARAPRSRRREHVEDRRQPLDRLVGAADHHAVAHLEAPDAAARADVHEVDALRLQLPRRGACRRSSASCRRR